MMACMIYHKCTWTTNPDFATSVVNPKDPSSTAPVIVRNSSSAIPALHQDLVNATKYVSDGATITLLKDVTTTETATIDKKVTLDLNGNPITNTAKHAINVNGPAADLKLVSNAAAAIKGKAAGINLIYGAVNVQQGKLTVGPNVKIEG